MSVCMCINLPRILFCVGRYICVCAFEFLYIESIQQRCLSHIPDGEWALRFTLSLCLPCLSQMEEEPFNPDYVEVDRVLEVSYCEDKDTGEVK